MPEGGSEAAAVNLTNRRLETTGVVVRQRLSEPPSWLKGQKPVPSLPAAALLGIRQASE